MLLITTRSIFFNLIAEDYLQSAETAPNYGLVLLTLLDSPECEMYIRVAAAVNFKNFIKRNWRIVSQKF